MNEGRIIEYIEQGNIICALCLQDKGNRLHLLTLQNREVNLSAKRALLVSTSYVNVEKSRVELLRTLKEREESRKGLLQRIDVEELWELVREEEEAFDPKYLAQLCFGEEITDDHVSALVRALFYDKLRFKMKDGRFSPHSEEKVEQIIREREEEAVREQKLKQGSQWIKGILQGKGEPDHPCREEIISLLVDLALHKEDAPGYVFGKDLLARSGIHDMDEIRGFLVKIGVWEEDENLDLLRLKIPTAFTEREFLEAEKLSGVGMDEIGREDLRSLHTITVDGPDTMDFDDALSLERDGDQILLGVHIADVAAVISEDNILSKEASQRASSLYLPRQQIPMIPPGLSHDKLSLIRDLDRPAISLLCRLDREGTILEYRFVPSIVRVKEQLTYGQVNEIYARDELLEEMVRLSQLFREQRIKQGALNLSLPEVSVRVGPDSSVSIELVSQETPSRMMVAEFMILYNWLVARFCKEKGVPILYRAQEEPTERLPKDGVDYIVYVFQQRRKLRPLLIDTEPKPHAGLGLDVYTNASSPIRRYLDIVIQRQLKNLLLTAAPLYNKEKLEEMRVRVEPLLRELARIKRNRTRYWIYKYLMGHVGERYEAFVLDVLKSKYRIILKDFLIVVEMKRERGQDLSSGQRIYAVIKRADPWKDELVVEYGGG
ncbi:MAG: RNB domain-containing ribonuclease [Deltaproteobacteria bacterium]|nr:RNB domain-containing ribonuclease [Deltaproteobacteria bacterium]MBW2137716.1 RNB domain-containing ribonuclease [Deltaproteobacteria bacterium]